MKDPRYHYRKEDFKSFACLSLVTRLSGDVLTTWHTTHKMWVLPGGRNEPLPGGGWEPNDECQARELREETGLDTLFAAPIYQAPSGLGDVRLLTVYHVFALGEPREMESGSPVLWMPLEEVGFPDANLDKLRSSFYQKFLEYIISSRPVIQSRLPFMKAMR